MKSSQHLFLSLLLISLLSLVACETPKPPAANNNAPQKPTAAAVPTTQPAPMTSGMGPAPAATAKRVKQPGAQIGDVTLCPTTGEAFTVTADSPASDYEGQKVYFCCDGCQGGFAKDPAGLLKKINDQIDADAAKK